MGSNFPIIVYDSSLFFLEGFRPFKVGLRTERERGGETCVRGGHQRPPTLVSRYVHCRVGRLFLGHSGLSSWEGRWLPFARGEGKKEQAGCNRRRTNQGQYAREFLFGHRSKMDTLRQQVAFVLFVLLSQFLSIFFDCYWYFNVIARITDFKNIWSRCNQTYMNY